MSDFETDSDTEIDIAFDEAAKHIQQIHDNLLPNDLLELYGLYKQATTGCCNTEKPGIFQMQARAKWNAWNELKTTSKDDAKLLYVEKVKQLDPNWFKEKGDGNKSKYKVGWVVHSIHQPIPDEAMDIEKLDHDKTALDFVKEGNLERLKQISFILDDFQQLDENGLGLIHWATDRNYPEILELILNKGANVNLCDAEQQTALHYAASCGHLECLKILLKFNADRLAKDGDGQTCLDVAESIEARALLNQ